MIALSREKETMEEPKPGRAAYCEECANRVETTWGKWGCAVVPAPRCSSTCCTHLVGDEEIARRIKEVRDGILSSEPPAPRQFTRVRSVAIVGVVGQFTRQRIVVDADGLLDPREVHEALRNYFTTRPTAIAQDFPEDE